MSDRWTSILKLATLLLSCLVLWQGSELFGTSDRAVDLEADLSSLALEIARAEKPFVGDSTNAPKPIPDHFVELAKAGAFGLKPAAKTPPPPAEPSLGGIAGSVAFIKMPSGMTRAFAVGDEHDGLRLTKVGVNRVLIEKEEKTRELTVFSGFGSESLLSNDRASERNMEKKP